MQGRVPGCAWRPIRRRSRGQGQPSVCPGRRPCAPATRLRPRVGDGHHRPATFPRPRKHQHQPALRRDDGRHAAAPVRPADRFGSPYTGRKHQASSAVTMPRCSPPNSSPGVVPNRSPLLMQEHLVLAFAQPDVRRPLDERKAPGALAGFAAFNGVLKPPPGFLIVQHFRPVLQHHLAQDVCHRVQVVQGIPLRGIVQAVEVAPRSAAVLGRAGAVARDAGLALSGGPNHRTGRGPSVRFGPLGSLASGSAVGSDCFADLDTRPAYRGRPYLVATPHTSSCFPPRRRSGSLNAPVHNRPSVPPCAAAAGYRGRTSRTGRLTDCGSRSSDFWMRPSATCLRNAAADNGPAWTRTPHASWKGADLPRCWTKCSRGG